MSATVSLSLSDPGSRLDLRTRRDLRDRSGTCRWDRGARPSRCRLRGSRRRRDSRLCLRDRARMNHASRGCRRHRCRDRRERGPAASRRTFRAVRDRRRRGRSVRRGTGDLSRARGTLVELDLGKLQLRLRDRQLARRAPHRTVALGLVVSLSSPAILPRMTAPWPQLHSTATARKAIPRDQPRDAIVIARPRGGPLSPT